MSTESSKEGINVFLGPFGNEFYDIAIIFNIVLQDSSMHTDSRCLNRPIRWRLLS